MANPINPAPLDSDVPRKEQEQARSGRVWIRLLGIAAFGLLVFTHHKPALVVKAQPLIILPLLICALAIIMPRRATAILLVGALLIWFMLPYAYP
jgi:hypothetical protein